MSFQESVLRQYMRTSGNTTLRSMADDTGLQITRIFRLLNGAEMKLNEYQRFYGKIQDQYGSKNNLQSLVDECVFKLPISSIKEMENILLKKLKLWNLTYGHNKRSKKLFKSINL